MIPWIQVYSNIASHPKTTKLADELKLSGRDVNPNITAVGMLVSLWTWAAQNVVDGDLSECTDRAIAEAAGYKKKPATFVAALIAAKYLDEDRHLHNWASYASLLIDCEYDQREKTRTRVAKYRERKKAQRNAQENGDCNGDCNEHCNVTVTPCNAPTKPNQTVPNQNNTGDAADESAPARERASEKELSAVCLTREEHPLATRGFVNEVRCVTDALMREYRNGERPAPWDYRNVARYCGDVQRSALLFYAFEKAAEAGMSKDWRYINGVMERLSVRGIETVEQARDWDIERPDLGA